jgi:hypothetical protein
LLAGHHDGETVSVSAVHLVARRHSVSSRQVTEILATMEIVAEDGPDLFSSWLDARLTGLAAGIAREARCWAVTLHEGGPRTAPRSLTPHGPTCALRCPRCWPGRPAMTTCAKSPATTSSAT